MSLTGLKHPSLRKKPQFIFRSCYTIGPETSASYFTPLLFHTHFGDFIIQKQFKKKPKISTITFKTFFQLIQNNRIIMHRAGDLETMITNELNSQVELAENVRMSEKNAKNLKKKQFHFLANLRFP